jgi:hypothetical protein
MTTEQIDEKIKQLEGERVALTAAHDASTAQLQQLLLANRNRYQQIQGAIAVLSELKSQVNGQTP